MLLQIATSVILGLVEGITEFLPISSTGHLILVNQWLSFDEPFTKIFDIVIQLGSILAAVVYFWPKLWPFNKQDAQKKEIFELWKNALIGVLPAIVIGGAVGSRIQTALFHPLVVAVALIIGGIILLLVERKKRTSRFELVGSIPWKIAFSIGLIQCLSFIPGTSRSAATIIGAMVLGVSRTAAVEFSFFLALPTMVAASAYSLLKHGGALTGSQVVLLVLGFITAFVTALAVIRYFIVYIKRHDFVPFAYYRVILGGFVFLYFMLR